MKVVMSLKNPHLVPSRKMPLGNYVVEQEPKEFDIKKADEWLLKSDQAHHWMNIEKVGKATKAKPDPVKVVESVEEVIKED